VANRNSLSGLAPSIRHKAPAHFFVLRAALGLKDHACEVRRTAIKAGAQTGNRGSRAEFVLRPPYFPGVVSVNVRTRRSIRSARNLCPAII